MRMLWWGDLARHMQPKVWALLDKVMDVDPAWDLMIYQVLSKWDLLFL